MSNRDTLHNRFRDYGAAPSADAWQNISATLTSKRKKKAVIWWALGGSGIAASIIFAVAFITSEPFRGKTFSDQQQLSIDTSLILEKEIEPLRKPEDELKNSLADYNSEKESTDKNLVEAPIEKVNNTEKLVPLNKNKLAEVKLTPKNAMVEQGINTQEQELFTTNANNDEIAIDLEVLPLELMSSRSSDKIRVDYAEPILSKLEALDTKLSRWQWGGELASNLAANTQVPNTMKFVESATPSTGLGTGAMFDSNSGGDGEVFYSKINRPISGSLLLRFMPTSKLFVEIDPNFTIARAQLDSNSINKWAYQNTNSPQPINPVISPPTKATFFNIGSGISVGYKFLNKNRWALDLAAGLSYERLTKFSLPITEEPINLFGNSVEFGINYHLSEKTSLRIAPEFSWMYGKTGSLLQLQFQNQRSIGVGISLLKDF